MDMKADALLSEMIEAQYMMDRMIERLHDGMLAHGRSVGQAESDSVMSWALAATSAWRRAICNLQGEMGPLGHYLENPTSDICEIWSC